MKYYDGSVEQLIAPITSVQFLAEYWEKKHFLVQRNNPEYYQRLLTIDNIDQTLSSVRLKDSDFRVANKGLITPVSEYLSEGANIIDLKKAFDLFDSGSTFILDSFHQRWPALAKLCSNLQNFMPCSSRANLYLTPSNSFGFSPHFDTHDVFILQIHGRKRWKIYESNFKQPLPHQDFTHHMPKKPKLAKTFDLDSGDLFYIPRGLIHSAESVDCLSAHITLGYSTLTWVDLLNNLVSQGAEEFESLRESLPFSYLNQAQIPVEIGDLTSLLMNKSLINDALKSLRERIRQNQTSLFDGVLSTQAHLNEVNLNSLVAVRDLDYELKKTSEDQLNLKFDNTEIELPGNVEKELNNLSQRKTLVVREISNELDGESKLALVKLLLKEHFLIIREVR